ncbi:MAG: DnaD domain protein [Clostridia bacterium]|nr:DnaD domain protein [Clostridia bacterium]
MSFISFKNESTNWTKVNNDFIKNEMPKMSGDFVKVYLYMLMLSSSGEGVDIENVASTFGIFTSELIKILETLNDKELIHFAKRGDDFELSFDGIQRSTAPVTVGEKQSQVKPQEKIDESLVTAYSTNVVTSKEESYSQQELEYFFEANPDITEIREYIETKFGQTFNPAALQMLVNILEAGYVPSNVIVDIVDYLRLNDKKIVKLPALLKAIENKAIDIHEKGLKNSDDIRDFLTNSDSIYKKVLKSYGLFRDISPVEKNYIDRWTITYHMPIEVINYAIERTLLSTQQASFPYTESILLN